MPGDLVTVRIRTLKGDAGRVYAVVNGVGCAMTHDETKGMFDFFSFRFTCGKEKIAYYFLLTAGDERVYYDRTGAVDETKEEHFFSFLPGFRVPEWALGTVYYQIFTDRFCNGNSDNDVVNGEYFYAGQTVRHVDDWNRSPAAFDVADFYGGDLQGVREKLDYLQSLGVETIYFNPLFVSPSNHKYDTQDYDHIDPHLAVTETDAPEVLGEKERDNRRAGKYIARVTSEDNLTKSDAYFADLVGEIHARGMRVIMDGVFNHCGSFHKWMDREGIYAGRPGYPAGAFSSPDSPYRSFFRFGEDGDENAYEGWWNHLTLPKLHYEGSPELYRYILGVGAKWVCAPYAADGWRLDVAADLGHSEAVNHRFWRDFRAAVRESNPEAVVLAEHYGDPAPWLGCGEWDTVMNYDAFMEPVSWFLTGMEKHSERFDGSRYLDGDLFFSSMAEAMARFPRPALDAAMNQLSNHDHSRFFTRTNRRPGTLRTAGAEAAMEGIDVRVMKLGVLIQMTWPGSPAVYYGDEAGQVGWTDPDDRRTYPWGRENKEVLDFHREAIALRGKIKCLKRGSMKPLLSGYGLIAYARFDGKNCAVVVINAADGDISTAVPVWEAGVAGNGEMTCVLSSAPGMAGGTAPVKDGYLYLSLPPCGGAVYTAKIG